VIIRLVHRWRTIRDGGSDAGMTLMELMVAMGIMGIFMGIATTAMVNIYSSTSKIQAVAGTSGQLSTAFDRLDKQVRYATAIDQPVTPPTSDWSVAFQNATSTGTSCTQLRVRTVPGAGEQQLVERSWTVTTNADGSLSATGISGWTQLADGVSLTDQNGAVTPFAVSTPSGASLQQLTLRLVALADNGSNKTRSASEVSFSALNSAAASTTAATGPVIAVCNQPEIT